MLFTSAGRNCICRWEHFVGKTIQGVPHCCAQSIQCKGNNAPNCISGVDWAWLLNICCIFLYQLSLHDLSLSGLFYVFAGWGYWRSGNDWHSAKWWPLPGSRVWHDGCFGLEGWYCDVARQWYQGTRENLYQIYDHLWLCTFVHNSLIAYWLVGFYFFNSRGRKYKTSVFQDLCGVPFWPNT